MPEEGSKLIVVSLFLCALNASGDPQNSVWEKTFPAGICFKTTQSSQNFSMDSNRKWYIGISAELLRPFASANSANLTFRVEGYGPQQNSDGSILRATFNLSSNFFPLRDGAHIALPAISFRGDVDRSIEAFYTSGVLTIVMDYYRPFTGLSQRTRSLFTIVTDSNFTRASQMSVVSYDQRADRNGNFPLDFTNQDQLNRRVIFQNGIEVGSCR